MAKSLQKIKSRTLRRRGLSILKIASIVRVAKSTVSLWCRDIELTESQKLKLLASKREGLRRGQLMGAEIQKKKRLDKIYAYRQEGIGRMADFGLREGFAFGLALYLAEGSKNSKGIIFTNSDPLIIKFMIDWFQKYFDVPKGNFTFYLMINEIHKLREQIVKKYWVKYLNISSDQFRKTTFARSKQKKIYENHSNYYGTIHFKILKSTELLYRIKGLIDGVFESRIVRKSMLVGVAQGLERHPHKVDVAGSNPAADTR